MIGFLWLFPRTTKWWGTFESNQQDRGFLFNHDSQHAFCKVTGSRLNCGVGLAAVEVPIMHQFYGPVSHIKELLDIFRNSIIIFEKICC